MPLLWTGLIFVLLKLSHVGPVAQWPWWGVLSPLFAVVVWFEWLETPLGRHRAATRAQGGAALHRRRLPARFGDRTGRH